ncbi:hypothetical protein [Streptomyces sp. NPDC001296]
MSMSARRLDRRLDGRRSGPWRSGLGPGPVTLSWTVAILGFVTYLAVSRRDIATV